MNRIKNQVRKCVLKMLYNSLVFPHMQYAILTWGFKLGRLNRLQKRAVRIISGSKYNSHTEPLFKKAQLLKLRDIFEINLFKIYHKFSNDNLPFYLKNMLKKFSPQHGYETRTVYILVEPESYTPNTKNCLRYELLTFINQKTDVVSKVCIYCYRGFASHLKKQILSSYEEICHIQQCYICKT